MASSEKNQERSMAAGGHLDEQLLIHPASPEDTKGGAAWLTSAGLVFLTLNSAMAVSSWRRDMGAVSFVAFSYLDLVAISYCLHVYRRTPPGSPRRENLRVGMWLLVTMLTISFFQLLEFWFT